ncbi:MAG: phosphate signaling complex protein PhoU [Actinomycetota bacterium]|nr:phosphate signaling complex protein PhoU [Actinomycetota bacterium]
MSESDASTRGTEHRITYHRELDTLNAEILRLGALVAEMVPRGTTVLLKGDLAEAQALVDDDDELDRLSLEIEERVYLIMARQAPLASELRRLITILKLAGELERSADLMVNVSKAARRMYGAELTPKIRGVIGAMASEAQKLVRLALEAFADSDESLAGALGDIDDQLDQLNREMIEAVFEAHSQGLLDIAAAVQLALIARYYERIGDHAVNIGQRVTYMVTGWLPEHTGALRANARRHQLDTTGQQPDAAESSP